MKRVPLVLSTTFCVLSALCILCGSESPAFAQQKESVTALLGSDDTLRIINVGVQENCASRFAIRVAVTGDVITVTERDTVAEKMRCICTYTLRAQIAGLAPGNYIVEVYREYLTQYGYGSDTTVFIGSVPVVWPHPAGSQITSSAWQSACMNAGIGDPAAAAVSLHAYPNPARGRSMLFYEVRGPGTVRFVFTDMLGREVEQMTREHLQAESAILACPPALFERGGTYNCVMRAGGIVRCTQITVLR